LNEKKNIKLAVDAFIFLKQLVPKEFSGLELVLAGGYDPNLPENVEHVKELKALVAANNINDQVRFLLSCSNEEKNQNLLVVSVYCILHPMNILELYP